MSIMQPWFERYEGRYEEELKKLDELNVEYTIDSELKKQGVLQLNLTIKGDNALFDLPDKTNSVELIAVFPDLYPYFRPDVYGIGINLNRHQNPFLKNLCLLPRETRHWDVDKTLGALLQSQLKEVIVKGRITDLSIVKADEDEQAEPFSEYFSYKLGNPVIFDTTVFPTAFTDNKVEYLGHIDLSLFSSGLPTKMLAIKYYNSNGELTKELPDVFKRHFKSQFKGYIYSIPKAPNSNEALEIFKDFKKSLNRERDFHIDEENPIRYNDGVTLKNVIGLTFPEEVGVGVSGQGWLFIVHYKKPVPVIKPKQKISYEERNNAYFAKVHRADIETKFVRTPSLKPLQDKTISIVGAGSIGAQTVVELARSGVKEIRILDHDVVEYGTTIRWPLGLLSTGDFKVDVLRNFIVANYPSVNIIPFKHKIGFQRYYPTVDTDFQKSDLEYLETFFGGCDLIYDCTGELGVMQYLSEVAKERNTPFISTYGTLGAAGGVIMRVIPEKTEGCWMCLQYKFDDKSIAYPPNDEKGKVQPVGCGDITFTGTSFDLANISMAGVRLAVSTLCEGVENGYPTFDWDVGILSLIDEQNKPIPPKWETYKLTIHPKCPYCSHE